MLHIIQKTTKLKKIKIIKIWNYEKKENTTFKLKSQVKQTYEINY